MDESQSGHEEIPDWSMAQEYHAPPEVKQGLFMT